MDKTFDLKHYHVFVLAYIKRSGLRASAEGPNAYIVNCNSSCLHLYVKVTPPHPFQDKVMMILQCVQ